MKRGVGKIMNGKKVEIRRLSERGVSKEGNVSAPWNYGKGVDVGRERGK